VAYLSDCKRRLGASWFQTPRETIKDFVGLLGVLEQNPSANWRDLLKALPTSAPKPSEEDAPPDAPEETSNGQPPNRDDDLTSFKL
jgi:hypothetical protein